MLCVILSVLLQLLLIHGGLSATSSDDDSAGIGVIGATAAASEECERVVSEQGCTVDHGHAQCEAWDFAASIHGLPACTTRITFSLLADPHFIDSARYHELNLQDVDFGHMRKLQELSMSTSSSNYYHVRLVADNIASFKSLHNLRILRMRMKQSTFGETDENAGMYSHLESLEVLDLSRAKRLGLSAVSHAIGPQSSIRTLILKNVQQIVRREAYSAKVDLAQFVCGGNVRHLDLSYNDIAYLNLNTTCWNSKLRYLNLDHNILLDMYSTSSVSFLSIFTKLESLHASYIWQAGIYQEGVWSDTEDHIAVSVEDDAIELSTLSTSIHFGIFAGYEFWLKDILQNCGNIAIADWALCMTHGVGDICNIFQCLSPQLNKQYCDDGNEDDKISYIAQNMCSYESCLLSFPIPIPPMLRSFAMHDTGDLLFLHPEVSSDNISTLCFHPHNNLEVIDISNMNLGSTKFTPGTFRVSGLHKLKYFNIQGCQLSLVHYHVIAPDMASLEELHIGGNTLSNDDVLPALLLRTTTQLSVLNLSNANLLGIEADAFLNHKLLSVLDLSHNSLDASSLSTIDFSKTSMKSLNLSHNQLTSIPASLRAQLDNVRGLQLYLSGNTFICNCDNLAFLHWVQSSTSISFHDAGDHLCTDSPGNTIHNIDVDSLHCNWYWTQPVIAVASSVSLTLFFLAVFVTYRKRWFISNLLFRLRERFTRASDDSAGMSYTYDAFVLYSSTDDDRLWVHYKLVSELEKVYGFRLCIHHRDFLGGCDIVDNIEQAIRTSRKVIIVMSENFLRSGWCIEEVHMTSSIDRSKFIVIMYKDVLLSAAAPVPTVVQRLLESSTYIEWDEAAQAQKLFWKKLRRALYSKHKIPADQPRPLVLDTDQSAIL